MRHRLPIVVAVALLAAPATTVTLASGATETTTTSSGADGSPRGGTATAPDPAATTTTTAPAPDPAATVPDPPATETAPAPPPAAPPAATNRPSAPPDPSATVDPTRLEPNRPTSREDGPDQRDGTRKRDGAGDRATAADRRHAAERRKRDRERSTANADETKPKTPEAAAQALLDAPATGLSALSVARFRIPPFLLPIYQAAGVQYGIRWEILAAINEIETDYGRNLGVSTAGALGWMQFMPATWAQYGVDATGDETKDPYNPVDAIFAAARYLKAAGGESDIRKAIFAYNHADWYVDDVLRRAASIASLPADAIASLTGLTLAQLPLYVAPDDAAQSDATPKDAASDADGTDTATDEAATDEAATDDATKADDPAKADADGTRSADASATTGDTADPDRVTVAAGPSKQWAEVRGPADAPVVAVQDGTVTRRGTSPRLGRFVEIRDAYGNRYTYAGLGTLSDEHLVPRRRGEDRDAHERETTPEAAAPEAAAPEAAAPEAAAPEAAAPAAAPAPAPTTTAASPGVGPAPPRVPNAPGGPIPAAAPASPGADAELTATTAPGPATIDPPATPTVTAPATTPATPTVPTTTPAAPTADPPSVPTTTTTPTTTAATTPAADPASPALTVPSLPAPSELGATDGGFGIALTAPVVRALAELQQAAAAAPAASATPAKARTIGEIDRYLVRAGNLRRSDVRLRTLEVGSKVLAGTVLGRMTADGDRSAIRFAIRPAGDGAPRIDPRPIVEGWRLLDDASVFGHPDDSALVADRGDEPDVGRLLLMSKDQLQRRVLANPSLTIYPAGAADIRAGAIDRRVLATMEYLTANGLKLSISSLKSGHSILSASGNVSAHSYGSAMDIAVVDGTPILGHQGAGSITDRTIRLLLRLQGTSKPNQIISLMTYPGTDNTLAMADHADHIHVGFPRAAGSGTVTLGRQVAAVLAPGQWDELVERLGRIENPKVRRGVSEAAVPAKPRTAAADPKRR